MTVPLNPLTRSGKSRFRIVQLSPDPTGTYGRGRWMCNDYQDHDTDIVIYHRSEHKRHATGATSHCRHSGAENSGNKSEKLLHVNPAFVPESTDDMGYNSEDFSAVAKPSQSPLQKRESLALMNTDQFINSVIEGSHAAVASDRLAKADTVEKEVDETIVGALELVRGHLKAVVHQEMDILRDHISDLQQRNQTLEQIITDALERIRTLEDENQFLRSYVSTEVLVKLQNQFRTFRCFSSPSPTHGKSQSSASCPTPHPSLLSAAPLSGVTPTLGPEPSCNL